MRIIALAAIWIIWLAIGGDIISRPVGWIYWVAIGILFSLLYWD